MTQRFLSSNLVDALLKFDVDIYDVLTGDCLEASDNDVELVGKMYEAICADTGFHPDDDCEEILNVMMDQIEKDYAEA